MRRYTEVEPKPVIELRPGDQVVTRKTVQQVIHTQEAVRVVWNDGTEQSWPLQSEPSVEVVTVSRKE